MSKTSNRPNGATPTWSGYVHQGKIGLLVALVEIERILKSGKASDLKEWSIRYEGKEDFDIINSDDLVWSRHQVKAYPGGSKLSDYSSVLKKDGFKTDGVRADENYLHTIVDILDWSSAEEKNPQSIKRYIYPDRKTYCTYADIEDENTDPVLKVCCGILKTILNTEDDVKIKAVWMHLTYLLDNSIQISHRDKSHPGLSFIDIYESVTLHNPLDLEDYIRSKRIALNHWDKYESKNATTVDPTSLKKASDIMLEFLHLPQPDFMNAMRVIHPNQRREDLSIQFKSMKKVVYRGFTEITPKIEIKTMSVNAHDNIVPYILTALDEEDEKKDYVVEILENQVGKNSSGINQIFKKGNIVTLDVNGNFNPYNTITTRVPDLDAIILDQKLEDRLGHLHIMEPVAMRFVDIDKAISEINTNAREGKYDERRSQKTSSKL